MVFALALGAEKEPRVLIDIDIDITRWPYAAFAGASKYGWGKKGGKEINGLELVKQTLESLTGYPAEGWAADTAELQESIRKSIRFLSVSSIPCNCY